MKRSVLIALAAFALAGCAKESVVDSALTNAGNAIGFNTYSNITRGNPFDNNPEFAASGNVFGVTAFISTSDSPYMGKADAGTEIVSDGTKWDYKNTSDIRYWPTQGETLSFYAYAPYTKNGVAIPVAYTKGYIVPKIVCRTFDSLGGFMTPKPPAVRPQSINLFSPDKAFERCR